MKLLAEIIGLVFDLLKAQEKKIVLSLAHIETGFAVLVTGLGALGLLTLSVFLALAKPLGNCLAALLTGEAALLVAITLMAVGRRMMR